MKIIWVLYIIMGNERHFPPTIVIDHFETQGDCEAVLNAVTNEVARNFGELYT